MVGNCTVRIKMAANAVASQLLPGIHIQHLFVKKINTNFLTRLIDIEKQVFLKKTVTIVVFHEVTRYP